MAFGYDCSNVIAFRFLKKQKIINACEHYSKILILL
jgi:hypothetical protein